MLQKQRKLLYNQEGRSIFSPWASHFFASDVEAMCIVLSTVCVPCIHIIDKY